MRIIALDVGDRRIGVAICDELEISANSLLTIDRQSKNFMGQIKDILDEYNVEEIVVGMPVMMNGTMGIQGDKVSKFIEELKNEINIPIKLFDERLSTKLVEKALIDADMRRDKRKKIIDQLSAVIILQDYMSSRSRG